MNTTIYFDMDGTIANLYGIKNWLNYLINEDITPYKDAKPLLNMNILARYLNRLRRAGYSIGIISWLSKNGSQEYNNAVTKIKEKWLKKHLKSVIFEEIHIVKYGIPKESVAVNPNGILFDDEERNRINWIGTAHDEKNILETLKKLLTEIKK